MFRSGSSLPPDPRGTGSVTESDARCQTCGAARGYIYTGPIYPIEELDQVLCPWCIADGTAAAKFDDQHVRWISAHGHEYTNGWSQRRSERPSGQLPIRVADLPRPRLSSIRMRR